MTATLNAIVSDGHVIMSFPEAAISAAEREDFIATVKSEWLARQSKLTEANVKTLADEVDSSWWAKNRTRILAAIGEA